MTFTFLIAVLLDLKRRSCLTAALVAAALVAAANTAATADSVAVRITLRGRMLRRGGEWMVMITVFGTWVLRGVVLLPDLTGRVVPPRDIEPSCYRITTCKHLFNIALPRLPRSTSDFGGRRAPCPCSHDLLDCTNRASEFCRSAKLGAVIKCIMPYVIIRHGVAEMCDIQHWPYYGRVWLRDPRILRDPHLLKTCRLYVLLAVRWDDKILAPVLLTHVHVHMIAHNAL